MKGIFKSAPNTDLLGFESASVLDQRVFQNLFFFNPERALAKDVLSELLNENSGTNPYLPNPTSSKLEKETLLKTLSEILERENFHTEYQPILSLETGQIFAYEALARFKIDGKYIPPDFVFKELHNEEELFFEFEKNLKRFQIRNRPEDKPLFLNLDPHVCKSENQAEHWRKLLSGHKNLVCEIIENTDSTLISDTRFCLKTLFEADIPLALDDVGGKENLFCFDFLEYSKFVKFDKHWLNLIQTKESYKYLLWGFLDFARDSNILCILEGIETTEDLRLASEMRFPLVQGYIFQTKNISV
ncbi:EAL domain-containing protein [Leptospira sp. 201903070]|uniref:EAL domain-containing protein n=1 Tax=Leptospira ainlahdjerensis TaxID=2810033 RepID=A0ABS2UDZ8_9LEPT|nr:EAL domain-containing protein [Leptospira ainlahdjerensis]MBM9578601.1 EAL domain-containing protein [Leptospira ainlahdjerensis]